MATNDEKVRSAMAGQGWLLLRDVSARCGVSHSRAWTVLNGLARYGMAEKRGAGRAVEYRLLDEPRPLPFSEPVAYMTTDERVVQALGRGGCMTASAIVADSGVSESEVYRALKRLRAQGRVRPHGRTDGPHAARLWRKARWRPCTSTSA